MKLLDKLGKALREALFPEPVIEPERLAVRTATPQDLDRVLFLNSEFAQEQHRLWGISEAALLATRTQLKTASADPRSLLLVGSVDGSVVAYALAEPHPMDVRRALWINGVYVSPPFRRSVLAEMLCRELVARMLRTGAQSAHTRRLIDRHGWISLGTSIRGTEQAEPGARRGSVRVAA
ncbi:MAG: GNAT family N-acetyltransferase [Candidatus Sericytochromatia bacterium]|nr:GNAT family N-acetyltransferase [Candidatus Tanganyikabacteria bacterium]